MKKKNLIGQRFHRLLVIEEAPSKVQGKRKRTAWLCKCDCGNVTTVATSHLYESKNRRSTKSCGCLATELHRKNGSERLRIANTKYPPSIATARTVWKNNYDDGCSFEEFYELSQMLCYYCKVPPSNLSNDGKRDKRSSLIKIEGGDFYYNGLDRLDSNRDHSIDNVVPCCKLCNRAKMDMPPEEFQKWLKRAAAHHLYEMTPDQLDEAVKEWKAKNEKAPSSSLGALSELALVS